MHEPPFHAQVLADGRTLAVSGCVDELTADEFRRALDQRLKSSAATIVDLSDVDFFPSAAVGVLIGAMKRGNDRIAITARRDCFAAKVLDICGIPFERTPGTGRFDKAATAFSGQAPRGGG
jgi:anti-anti-sigma factor